MNEEMKTLGQTIDLGDNIKLVYQKPEVFSKYHIVYHGYKYSDYYFRSTPETLLQKAKYIDSGYFILKEDKIIGGVFIKPNFMGDLFIVPPYNDFDDIADRILKFLKSISKKGENILLQEIVENLVHFYESKGCIVHQKGFWMLRPTEEMNTIIPDNYESKPILEEDKNEIADLIVSAYNANPSFKDVDSKENYAKSIEWFIKNYKDNEVLYNSSKVVVCKDSKEIVGICYHMEFEGFPLITQIAVSPNHQGNGIGSYLLKHSINYTSSIYSAIRLYVYNNNPALKLYEHIGFIKNKTLNDMYLQKGDFYDLL